MDLNLEYFRSRDEINKKLKEFSSLDSKSYFYELVFCILTPQSNAEKCWSAVSEMKERGFSAPIIKSCLISKTRFHKNKARYIQSAIKKWNETEKKIKEINCDNVISVRNWIADNVLGIGLKEASHFLRNIGKSFNRIAILDRHILRRMKELGIIDSVKLKNRKDYLEKEKKYLELASNLGIPADELDLLFWKIESGRIFK